MPDSGTCASWPVPGIVPKQDSGGSRARVVSPATQSFSGFLKQRPLWDLLVGWGCDPSLLRITQMLHGGTSHRARVHGGVSKEFGKGPQEGPSSPVLFNIYHAAVMLDFRARRQGAAKQGALDEGVDWVAQIDG